MNEVSLREVVPADLPIFFAQQLDPEANRRAVFGAQDPADRDAFEAHWVRILGDDQTTIRTILLDAEVAGHVAGFERLGQPEVAYWLGREFWGRGVATRALAEFLKLVTVRPLFGRVARDNVASVRVLEKCGFVAQGFDHYFSHVRGEEVEEVILVLVANEQQSGT